MFLQQRLQPRLGQSANRAVNLLAVLKHNQRGDAHDAILHGQVLVVVDVAFGNGKLARQRWARGIDRARTTVPKNRPARAGCR